METEFDDYSIKLTMTANLPSEGEENDYLTEISGDIFHFTGSLNLRLCGRLNCYFVNLQQVFSDGFSYFEILDAHSAELAECATLFKGRQGYGSNLRSATRQALKVEPYDILPAFDNFVYVRRLEILPKHRGKGLGKFVLRQSLSYLAETLNFDFFAMKPFPLQSEPVEAEKGDWRARLQLEKLEPNHQQALQKLRNLYAELGFVLVKGTGLMVCQSEHFRE